MSESDPHIHVEVNLHADTAVRDVMASTFGLAGDLPSLVNTGCGLEVPHAMTSARPESVTCLECRRHAHRRHLRLADETERIGRMPGMSAEISDGAVQAGKRHRDLAMRFVSDNP
ncbi:MULTISPECIES: hypothetical protein [Actinomadura]|uniref:Uncharacterized protein n=1 Tax=Actinomadura yumaensis TaxID=111807 RepID=A0ABW2CEY4_9ACTN|nr:hypothetical protein [Actinomadura sp. J1-007]MWK34501.1 hypothetical protein [Actinomadura sp. J1-007]